MHSTHLFGLLSAFAATPAIVAAYDTLLFTEDFFPLINTRLDPIVTPGKVSSHVHHVVGSSAFSATQDHKLSQSGKCTTSNLNCDKSNYWTPQLYYKWKNGTYTAVTGDGMTNYWKYPLTNTDEANPFAEIPDDFRMLAGDVKRDDFDVNKAVSFLCVDAQYSYDYTDYMPTDRECLTLRPQLHFPECWNGVDSYKEDNSHVAYPVDANPEGGKCPDGYKKIPHLFMESTYHIKTENIGEGYEWYPGCFVLANGDNHGFSLHADWLNGFPTNFLTDAFHQCYDKASGEFTKDCQFIQQYRGDIGRDCVSEGDVVNELVGQHFAIPALPGNNPEYNSSKLSDNYPKKEIPGYTEQASIVKATEQNGGLCNQGVCTDYKGNDAVIQQQQAGNAIPTSSGPTSSAVSAGTAVQASSAADYGVTSAVATPELGQTSSTGAPVESAVTGIPTSDTLRPTNGDLGSDATMSILPITTPGEPAKELPTMAAIQIGVAGDDPASVSGNGNRWGGGRWSRMFSRV
ncbi:uncharacterized protein L201_001985 [Kwoniella dendrophila CBS 6074]|uniref:DUF1996 domain-containing protein n=1 Tax=Kwoniella dendrophila CBS 6074 TaxID=1295534 RepID=A0AAX4JQU7_9TREE